MAISREEVQKLNKQRTEESARDKAEAFKARTDADAENGWNAFLARHSGPAAVARHDVFHCFQANYQVLEEWILAQGLLVNDMTLERSFQANKSRLATRSPEPYQRRTNTLESRVMPQLKSFGPPALALPYTRKEILSWSKERLRRESRTPGRVAALNKILAGQGE